MPAPCALDSSLLNWAMLRFRPIAPKPSGRQPLSPPETALKNRKRTKRKYVRVRDRRRTIKGKGRITGKPSRPENSGVDDKSSSPDKGAVTLQLMPEPEKGCDNSDDAQKTDHGKKSCKHSPIEDEVKHQVAHIYDSSSSGSAKAAVQSVTKTWIMVECVTEACAAGSVGLGLTDWEKMNNLRRETCPGFVSDGRDKVLWVNEAYRKIVGEGGPIMVWLAMKEEVELGKYGASFACRVRMTSRSSREGGRVWHRVVACDVWRMDFAGGYAWKLDITTALGLGLGLPFNINSSI